MKRSRDDLGLLKVLPLSLLLVLLLVTASQGQTSLASFKDVIRGDGVKA